LVILYTGDWGIGGGSTATNESAPKHDSENMAIIKICNKNFIFSPSDCTYY
jgi:hypothetical protein